MFFILPIAVDYKAQRYPMVTFVLIGLNVLLYVATLGSGISVSEEDGAKSLLLNMCLVPSEKTWWTWFTSMFAHAGFFHVAGNMVYLFLFGACVEDLLGRVWYAVFYMAGGLVANLSQVLLTVEADADIPILGASGAVSACIGAFLVLLPKRAINFQYFGWFFFRSFVGEFALKAWKVILFWFLLDFASLVTEWGNPDGGGGVAFAAHVGGTLAGGFAMVLLRKVNRSLTKRLQPGSEDESENEDEDEDGIELAKEENHEPAEEPAIYLSINGDQAGPYPISTVRSMVGLGSIPSHAFFWREGMEGWRPVSELEDA